MRGVFLLAAVDGVAGAQDGRELRRGRVQLRDGRLVRLDGGEEADVADGRHLDGAQRLQRAEPLVVYWLLQMMGILPRWFHRLIVAIFGAKATAVMTNMPGPREQLYLAGRPLRDLFFWVPQSGSVGLGFAICSYNGRIRVGIGTDAGLVPDPESIVEEFHAEIEEMRRRAGA